jgi:predicted Zn-dependent protease
MRLRRYQEAVEQLEIGVQLNAENPRIYDALAKAYARLNRPEEAIAAAETGRKVANLTGARDLADQIDAWLTNFQATQDQQPRIAP